MILSGLFITYYIISCLALAYCVADSERWFNKYGPNPKPIYE